jgi:peptidoglycan-associated lipoprotein
MALRTRKGACVVGSLTLASAALSDRIQECSMRLDRVLLIAFLAATALVALGCPGPEYPKCENDSQCKKNKDGGEVDEYCLLGQCQECAKDSHCGAGESCNRGRCEQACAGDEQCGDGSICEASVCVKAQCTANDACGTGGTCEKGRCKSSSTVDGNGKTTTPTDGALDCQTASRISFDFNAADLRPDARSRLDTLAKCMKKNGAWRLNIEGHCDERGTPEYNLSLGENRAKSARKYLTALGVEDNRIKVVSYGEEKPVNSGSSEEAWAENRRAELVVKQ